MSKTMKKQNNMGAGVSAVPPGFRFHPTDEELLRYYLKRKISCEPIDFDVIREVDLNKLEPWDLKEMCRIGSSGIEDEWYFLSHKDKKYPTGTRTNRATIAGFWKATGRDKPIHSSSFAKKIGMRKTLVFYKGRAPRGHKTDWIMHEYRLDNDDNNNASRDIQEDGWVICRVTFKKKNQNVADQEEPVNMQSSLTHLLMNHPESTIPIPTSHPYSEDWLLLDRLLAMDQRFPCSSNSSYHHVFEPEFAKYSK